MSNSIRPTRCGMILALAFGVAAWADEPPPIRWRAGATRLPSQDARDVRASLTQLASRAGARHFVVQFDRTPRRAQSAELETAGVTLLSYLGNHAFFAAVSGGRADTTAVLGVLPVRSVSPIDRSWKLHPQLMAGVVPPWAIVPGRQPVPHAAVYVLLHRDVPLVPDGVAMIHRHDGTVRSLLHTVNGLVVELPRNAVPGLADEDAVQWVEPPLPPFSVVNDSNRVITEADIVQSPPYGLTGEGVTVLVYDGGMAAEGHPDFGGRLIAREDDSLSNHATHVSGTIGGDGVSSDGLYRGMAPGVRVESYSFNRSDPELIFLYEDPGDIERNYAHAIHVFGADVSNNSIGTNTCRNGFDCNITGDYGVTAQLIDSIVAGSLGRPFRVIWANGNERGCTRCLNQGVHTPEGYHSTAPPACAKNQIAVGALNSNDDSVTSFTSWGPCDDGRIKPDIAAPGCQADADEGVTSCCFVSGSVPACAGVADDCCNDTDGDGFGYNTLCGTSMATPTVTGLSALVLQDYRAQYPDGPDPRNSTLKALFAHNAADLGPPGPDYQTGYGSVRVQRTVDFLRGGTFVERQVEHEASSEFFVAVEEADVELKVTLAWDDTPATPNVQTALVNDLDLLVHDPQGLRHYPWTLDPAEPGAPAARQSADHVNNVEQVFVESPAVGLWRVSVVGTDLPSGLQSFSLCASPRLSADCNANGLPDEDELAAGSAEDCTRNGVLDECEPDCNANSVADSCDIAFGTAQDCNGDGVPDATVCDPFRDCNGNGVHDPCDISEGRSRDCNRNWIPDACENCNGTAPADECDIAHGLSIDCNLNGRPDECDLASGDSPDCNANATPDECEVDCNENTFPDDCDITAGVSADCNGSAVPDECELADESSSDCNTNDTPDECDIAENQSADCNADGVPDDCQLDCNGNDIMDVCDITYGTSEDADGNLVPDECLRILRVPSEYPTLQSAIDSAHEGDTVLAAPGVYSGIGNKNLVFAGKNLTVRCEGDPGTCVIDCQNNGRGFVFDGGETRSSLVEGMTVRHGSADSGGAIVCTGSSPRIVDCILEDNFAFQFGGAIDCQGGSPLIRGCKIVNNGGLFFAGGINCAFSEIEIVNCLLGGNLSTAGVLFGDGGGLYAFDSDVIIDSCLLVGNRAAGQGGAVYGWQLRGAIRNTTIVGNVAGRGGGALSIWKFSAPVVNSSIVWDNQAPAGAQISVNASTVELVYSDLAGGPEGVAVSYGGVNWGPGSFTAMPDFVGPVGPDGMAETWEDNDYHLADASPGVNAGDPERAATFGESDYDREPRVLGGRVDIGFDEVPADCDDNGVFDYVEIAAGSSQDCNGNLIPDGCDLASGHSPDADENGTPDECECTFDATPPRLDHDRMCSGGSGAFPFEDSIVSSGYIDPRRSTFDGETTVMGMRAMTLVFTEPVFDVGSTSGGTKPGTLTRASFTVGETGAALPNSVAAILSDLNDPARVRVELQRFITPREWTTIIAHVEDACGNVIPASGHMGPGVLEPDRIDVGYLPGDVNQDGVVGPFDLMRFRQIVAGLFTPPCLHAERYADTDRDGAVTPTDLLRLRQAIFPIWAGASMNSAQP